MAKLDGWVEQISVAHPAYRWQKKSPVTGHTAFSSEPPHYFLNRDHVMPLVEKLCADVVVKRKFIFALQDILGISRDKPTSFLVEFDLLTATPLQLCEALLRALNLWEE